mgnify:CR=1 FL=1
MQKISYYLKPRATTRMDGTSLVYILVRIDGDRKEIPTNLYVPSKNWDRKKREVKAGKGLSRKQALTYNLKAEDILERCHEIVRTSEKRDENLDVALFAHKIKNGREYFEFVQFCEEYIRENPDNWGKATLHSYQGALRVLKDHFGKVLPNELPEFKRAVEKKLANAGNSPNTIKKRQQQFKTLLKQARKRGYQLPIAYDTPIGIIKGNRQILTVEELSKAIRFFKDDLLPPGQQHALRLFLFCCFTGCRYSDVIELTHKNIAGDVLTYIAQKTKRFNKEVQVPLPEVAKPLIENYKGRLFKPRSNQVLNRRLKEVFRQLQINKNLSFHCSRHTFGTLYIYLGGDVTNLQLLMAHSSIETTMNYVKAARRLDVNQTNYFDEEFAKSMQVIVKAKSELKAVG